jgi:leucyl aminopeptidase (aminopeptidase T)
VLISGKPSDMPLLESIAVCVRKAGAFPIITVGSERLTRRMYDEVPATFDSQAEEFDLALAGMVNASITVDSTENESLLADIPPARVAANTKSRRAVEDLLVKRGVRTVSLGNGMAPTDSTAKKFGIDKSQLAKLFWSGVNTDYAALQARGARVQKVIARGKTVQITNPNGTDLSFRVEGRGCYVSDGVISKEDMATGGPACQVWLPAGEVYAAPVPGSANGRVVIDRMTFQGSEITNLTLEFKNGKVTSMTAAKGLEPLKAAYDAGGAGKDEFAFFDIGINTDVKAPANTKFLSWVPAGMVSVGIGSNTWAGGTNTCGFSMSGFLPGSTVTIDSKPLVHSGELIQ